MTRNKIQNQNEGSTINRRRMLGLVGGVALAGLAGCTSGFQESPDGGGNGNSGNGGVRDSGGQKGGGQQDGNQNQGSYDCSKLSGTGTVRHDLGNSPLPFSFGYPNTWETYNEEINETKNIIGVQIGHLPSESRASWRYAISVHFWKKPATEEVVDSYMNNSVYRDGGTFTFDGSERRYVEFAEDYDNGSQLRFILVDGEDMYPASLTYSSDDGNCVDEVENVALNLMNSFETA